MILHFVGQKISDLHILNIKNPFLNILQNVDLVSKYSSHP